MSGRPPGAGWRFLPHTADAKFVAWGADLAGAFGQAALAQAALDVEPARVPPAETRALALAAESREALLYDFLEWFLIARDADGFLLRDFASLGVARTPAGWRLEAAARGGRRPAGERCGAYVKAVTYAEMAISDMPGRAEVTVVVDL